jgi:hypothetical protein
VILHILWATGHNSPFDIMCLCKYDFFGDVEVPFGGETFLWCYFFSTAIELSNGIELLVQVILFATHFSPFAGWYYLQ